jgi:hypothetical protein
MLDSGKFSMRVSGEKKGVAESRYESGRNRNFPELKIMD